MAEDKEHEYLAVYFVLIEDSDSHRAKILLEKYKYYSIEQLLAEDSVCKRVLYSSFFQLQAQADLPGILADMHHYYRHMEKTNLYIAAMIFASMVIFKLEHKLLTVDDFLTIHAVYDENYMSVTQILLESMLVISSTVQRRVSYSKLLQTIFLYAPYYGMKCERYLSARIMKAVAMDIIDSMQNVKNARDVVEGFNLFTVLISQLPAETAKLLCQSASNYVIVELKKANSLMIFLLLTLQKAKSNLNRFIQEAIMFISLVCFKRQLDPNVIKFEFTEDFFYKIDDSAFVNRYVEGLCFIPHALLYHYSLKTYLYSETIHLQTDLLSSILYDIDRSPCKEMSVSDGVSKDLQSEDENTIVVLLVNDNDEYTFFKFVKFTKTKLGLYSLDYLASGKYRYMELHGSTPMHLQILITLKQILAEEIYHSFLTNRMKTTRHAPILIVLNSSPNASEDLKETVFPVLAFSKNENYAKAHRILLASLQDQPVEFVPDSEKPEIKCRTHRYTLSPRLYKLIAPLKASYLACLLHIMMDDSLFIIGAPGTGKTFTAASIIRLFLIYLGTHFCVPENWKEQPRYVIMKQVFPTLSFHCEYIGFLMGDYPQHYIILTAHSNNATDYMAEALLHDNFPLTRPFIFRAGSGCYNEELQKYTMDGYLALFWQDLVKFQLAPPMKHPKITDLLAIMQNNVMMFKDTIRYFKSRMALQHALLQKANILVMTMNGLQANVAEIAPHCFLIIEEAARVAEYNIATVLPLAPEKLILIGDVMYLPPVIKDPQLATKAGLVESFFHKAVHRNLGVIVLDEQMRVHSRICDLYRDVYCKNLPPNIALPDGLRDSVASSGNAVFAYYVCEQFDNETNAAEADAVYAVYTLLIRRKPKEKVSVLALYKKQALHLEKLLKSKTYTVDEYQGLENDAVIVSLCITHPSKFANDLNRTLVAFSRAKCELHVIGNIERFDNDIFAKLKTQASYCTL